MAFLTPAARPWSPAQFPFYGAMSAIPRDVLHVGPSGFGLLRAGPAVGATLAALWLSAHPIHGKAGAYMFGDLSLARTTGVMGWDDVAVHVLATVIDLPEPGLALIDVEWRNSRTAFIWKRGSSCANFSVRFSAFMPRCRTARRCGYPRSHRTSAPRETLGARAPDHASRNRCPPAFPQAGLCRGD